MKKNVLLLAASAAILIQSCKEVGPAINFADITGFDTTYTMTPPAADARRVLVEEATGVKCPNCPAGAATLKQAEAANPGRVIVVGLHAGALTTPIIGESQYDFRTSFAQDLFTILISEPNKPAASFDRVKQNAAYFVESKNLWTGIIDQRLQVPSPVKLEAESHFDDVSGQASIKVKIIYLQEITKKQALSVVVVEDSIIDAQIDGINTIDDYVHNHVLRTMLTPVGGLTIPDNAVTKSAGRVFEKTFLYTPQAATPAWNLDKCKVILFVHDTEGDDKEVAQALEIELKD